MGCAQVISEPLRQQIEPGLTFAELTRSPDDFIGKTVMLGGEIVQTRNLPGRSEIVVVQKELSYSGRPSSGDNSGGRFIFVRPGYLESEIYSKGRLITGAGKVAKSILGKVGELDYRFPVIEVEELHLWEQSQGGYYSPYWYWSPYWWYPYPYYYGYGYGYYPYYW